MSTIQIPAPDKRSDPWRYPSTSRNQHSAVDRAKYAKKKGVAANPLTTGDRAKLKEARDKSNELAGTLLKEARDLIWEKAQNLYTQTRRHDTKYWFQAIVHMADDESSERKHSEWVAWESVVNDRRAAAGEPRLKADALAAVASAEWKTMSSEERTAQTKDKLEELAQRREVMKFAPHNVGVAVFNDTRSTLAKVQNILEALYERTGVNTPLFATRNDKADFLRPNVFSTGDNAEKFFFLSFRKDATAWVTDLEIYALKGALGTIMTKEQELAYLRARAGSLMKGSLEYSIRPFTLGRMFYTNFYEHITLHYHIILKGWPLTGDLRAPSTMDQLELETVIKAFKTGSAEFVKATEAELEMLEKSNGMIAAPAAPDTAAAPAPAASASGTDAAAPASGPDSVSINEVPHADSNPPIASTSTPPIDPNVDSASTGAALATGSSTVNTWALYVPPTGAPTGTTMVLSRDGLVPQEKKRKQRSDKGAKRGPNKRTKKTAENAASRPQNTPAAAHQSAPNGQQNAGSSSS